MRRFHSYGPVDCEEHFCVPRTALVEQCVQHLVGGTEKSGHYFKIFRGRGIGRRCGNDRGDWVDVNLQRSVVMISGYMETALRQARYEILEDQTFYGEIPDLEGVYANAATLEECREQLRKVLEGWIILGLRMGHRMPKLNGLSLDGDFRAVRIRMARMKKGWPGYPRRKHPDHPAFHPAHPDSNPRDSK